MRNLNLENVQEAEDFKKMIPGGYIAKINSVFDNQTKEYLEIELDIASGEFKEYYLDLYNAKGFWGLKKYLSYKEKALPMFKAFITATETSNAGYNFLAQNYNEKSLVGKYVGVVLGLEQYESNDGEIKERIYIDKVRSVEKIKNGEFEIPKLKLLNGGKSDPVAQEVDDNDLPF